jgi:hypothetical protein
MTAEEFVAKYGVTGGADEVWPTFSASGDTLAYKCLFSLAGRDDAFAFTLKISGNSPYLMQPLTPVTFVLLLLAQVTHNDRFAPACPGGCWNLNYTERDVAQVRKWMDSDAMWSDFLTIMPS